MGGSGRNWGRSFTFTRVSSNYDKGAGPHLAKLRSLIRIGKEAKGESDRLQELTKGEGISENDDFLVRLGPQASELLNRMTLEQVPEYLLDQEITLRARLLAGELGGRLLRDYLFSKFQQAGADRLSFSVVDLISEGRGLSIPFQPPPEVDTKDISALARSSLIILQACSAGIPTEVIASALDCSQTDVTTTLEELQRANVVALDNELWSMKPLPSPITSNDSQTVLAKALSSLLIYIGGDEAQRNIRRHVKNIIDLARECTAAQPKLVASVFIPVDKQLKRLGNKRQVWYVANLSIQAARIVPIRDRDAGVIDAEARALICGTSWAFQRLHKLDKARVDANHSLELARDAGLDRTLAFCLKCIGRLCRMEAEAMPPGEDRKAKLDESVAFLREAIAKFSSLIGIGSSHPEVGDCYSLLGRSFLVQRQLRDAGDSIRAAYRLITDETSKDYIDLLILNGDYDVANGERRSANSLYDRAIEISMSPDPEVSEMRARALLQRGSNQEAQGNKPGAERDYLAAAGIWNSLEDYESAAIASWKNLCLTAPLSEATMKMLNQERIIVRVETLTIHLSRLKQTTGKTTVARRNEPPQEYWKQIIVEAKARLALRIREL
jgi:tetratricopeptide (TPR) repeat protein